MHRLLLLAFAAAVLAAGVLARLFIPGAMGDLRAYEALDKSWRKISHQAVGAITAGSVFADRFGMATAGGAAVPRGVLEFLIFDSRLSSRTSQYDEVCAYIGSSLQIVCDVAFVDDFLWRRGMVRTGGGSPNLLAPGPEAAAAAVPASVTFYPSDRRDMLTWVLGHEVGHAQAGHQAQHFFTKSLEQAAAAPEQQSLELEADRFVASKFDPNDPSFLPLYQFLVGVLNAEIRSKACPDQPPALPCENIIVGTGLFEPKVPISFSVRGSHPEYVVRLTRMFATANDLYDFGLIGYINQQIMDRLREEQP